MSIKPKNSYIMCFEGEAEQNLFGFLKSEFFTGNKNFKPHLMGGFDCLNVFEKKYKKALSKHRLTGKLKGNIHFIFMADKDLEDSSGIENLILSDGHLVQFCELNIEVVLLRLKGINLIQDTNLKDFRDKCKKKFKEVFGKEAHQMKADELRQLISSVAIFEQNFPIIASIFS